MMEKYRERFETLTTEEVALVGSAVLKKLGIYGSETVPDTGSALFDMCACHQMDQAGVVLALSRDATPLGVSALEKIVGKPIQRQAATGGGGGGKPRAQRGPRPQLRDDRVIRMCEDASGVKYGPENNPKKKGSATYERFALYSDGMTVQEFRAAGGKSEDVKWDAERGFIRVEDPEPKEPKNDSE